MVNGLPKTTSGTAVCSSACPAEKLESEIGSLRAERDELLSHWQVKHTHDLVTRLREALVLARKEISDHDSDYHHRTRDSTIACINAALGG